MAYALTQELTLIPPEDMRLYIDAFEDLTLELADGKIYKAITVLRAFPISALDEFLILNDEDGNEIGTVRDLNELDSESQRVLQDVLNQLYFVAEIIQVNVIEEQSHIPKWDVETDRGPRTFDLASTRRDIRILERGRILIRDADGNRYEIPDYRQLDAFSNSRPCPSDSFR